MVKKHIFLKKIILVFIFIGFASLFAQTFSEVDFERLILNHPMMKNYDPKTGYFKNTPYALQDVEKLKKEVGELEKQLIEIKNRESKLSNKIVNIEDIEDDEEVFWNNVNDNSKQIESIQSRIGEKNELISNNGEPDYQNLFNIVSKVSADVILPLYDKNKIVLNSLPKYYFQKPKVGFNFNARDLLMSKNEDSIKEYIKQARDFATMFPDTNKTILYNSNKAIDLNKIGTIDLTLAFLLHPKMAKFNFIKMGFNKYDFGLTYEEQKEFLETSKSIIPQLKIELENLKNELSELSFRKKYYYNKHRQDLLNEEKYSYYKENFLYKEKGLNKKIFDIDYQIKYSDLTNPEESIKIIEEIYKDLDDAIEEVKKDRNLNVILNSSIYKHSDYKYKFKLSNITGLGHAGVNYSLFYTFYNQNHLSIPFKKYEKETASKRWLKLLAGDLYKEKLVISLKPHPVVITGGKSILAEVVKILYDKYNINKNAYKVIDSVIDKIEAYQNGFDY